jgi:hypothetical protein
MGCWRFCLKCENSEILFLSQDQDLACQDVSSFSDGFSLLKKSYMVVTWHKCADSVEQLKNGSFYDAN